jgi:hypothetical protein
MPFQNIVVRNVLAGRSLVLTVDAAVQETEAPAFPCPVCGKPVLASDPGADWMCGTCGEIHLAKGPLAPSILGPASALTGETSLTRPFSDQPGTHTGTFADLSGPAPPPERLSGRPRNLWVCVWLGILTLGIYFVAWRYLVFREVARQGGRRHSASLLWAGVGLQFSGAILTGLSVKAWDLPAVAGLAFVLLGAACDLAYVLGGIQMLRTARAAAGLSGSLGPGLFAFLYAPGQALGAMAGDGELGALIAFGIPAFLILLLVFAMLQGDLNEYWRALATRRDGALSRPPA